MKFYFLILTLFVSSIYSFGQTIYQSNNGKWGLKDTNGSIMITAKYDKMFEFSSPLSGPSNYIAVSLNGKSGVVERKTGEEIVQPKYDDMIMPLTYESWGVKLNGKWGFINHKDEVIIPFIYDDVGAWSTRVKDRKVRVVKDGKEMYLDKYGKRTYDYDGIGKFNEGLAVVYNLAGLHSDVLSYNTYIDEEGNEIVPLKYEGAKEFRNGVGILIFENAWGAVDRHGKTIIPFEYDHIIHRRKEGNSYLVRKNGKFGIIDKNNNVIVPISYNQIRTLEDNAIVVERDKKYGYLDDKYKEFIQPKYDFADRFSDSYAVVKSSDNWEIIDKKGNAIVSIPISKYDDIYRHTEGMLGVKKNDKWGFIDLTGKEIISLTYESIGLFSKGLSMVKLNGKWGAIDKRGKIVYEIKYPNAFVLNDEMNK